VSDVRLVSLHGLERAPYVNTVGGVNRPCSPDGAPLRFTAETDRIYPATPQTCSILDPAWSRKIVVSKRGSLSTVVWNPWLDKANSMPDLGGAHFPAFVCLETTNCGDDVVTVPGGATRALSARIASMRC
jgi:glucose-6-phosphate 1-epimerase